LLEKTIIQFKSNFLDFMSKYASEKAFRKVRKDVKKFDFNNGVHCMAFVLWSLQCIANFTGLVYGVGEYYIPLREQVKKGSAIVPKHIDFKEAEKLHLLHNLAFQVANIKLLLEGK